MRLKAGRHAPRFLWHALRCITQARNAPGCLGASARTIDGVHHTMTVWESPAAMRAFVASGPHLKAMNVFPRIATGKVVSFHTDAPPSWDDAHAIWDRDGREVQIQLVRNQLL